ncbi:DUF1036 domain-containing protein [Azorhizobium doebereinerae]|uniref:DUF1036 domain-containing protein n=1 Tax=Azorhizobium doebereinerae TaxID=281091 RepID=UPI000420A030|nr:DUF1036 domain-containing protein [Azorhizobium doebereinerae]
MLSADPTLLPGIIRPLARPLLRGLLALLAVAGTTGLLSVASATPAAADFRLCNRTQSRVGVAIGYKEGDSWATEGWWNVSANSCETLLRGDLVARFYYLYAVDYDQGGEWSGKAFMCTRDKEFTIRGVEDCLARGFDRTGFLEVDTREQKGWTVQLTEGNQSARVSAGGAGPIPMPMPAPPARSKTP